MKISVRCLEDVLTRFSTFILETSRRINKALKTSWRHLCKTFWWCSKEVWPRQINSCWRGLKVVCLRGRQKTFSRRLHQDAHLLTKLYPIHWLKSNISTDGTTFPKSWNIKENYKSIKETSYLYQWCFSFTSNSTGLVLLFLLLLFFCFFLFWFFDFFVVVVVSLRPQNFISVNLQKPLKWL